MVAAFLFVCSYRIFYVHLKTIYLFPFQSVSEIGIAGKMVEEEFERLIQKYLPCYMDIYDEIHHRQSTSPVSDSDSSKSKKSKNYEHDPTVSINLH